MKIRLLFSSIVAVVLSAAAFAQTFNYTGSVQAYVVPVTGNYSLDVRGAQSGTGEFGGQATGILSLTAGQTIYIYVGGAGASGAYVPGGFNGGGQSGGGFGNEGSGGGASDIRVSGTALTNRVIVAGGAGGRGGWAGGSGGSGGGLNGTNGFAGQGPGGGGGSQVSGGLSYGGASGFGFGGSGAGSCYGGGGGGGGYYGGGGGGDCDACCADGGGGGGGSSYIGGVASGTTTSGFSSGNGLVVMTLLCAPTVLNPTVGTLPDINVSCSISPSFPTATNNCGLTVNGVPNVSFPITTQGTTVVTWTYNDGVNTITQTQNVIIDDVTNPTLSCPANINVNNSAANCSALVTYTAPVGTDNCAGVVTTQTAGLTSGSTFPVGLTINTFLTTDVGGNTSSCSFNVVVTDNELPVATCQNAILQLDGTGNVMLNTIDINAGSSDNCAIASLSLSQTNFDCSDLGLNTVTLLVTDNSGNTNTCLATVTVQDIIAPTVSCTNITVNNVPNNCGRVVTYTVPVATDNCAVTVTQTDGTGFTSGDLFPVGTTIQQYTYTDAAGNTVACSFNVIVLDFQNPTITPLTFSNITVNNTLGMCGANVPWLEPTASDNCPGVILTASNTMGSFFPIGTTTVTYTATDASLNTSTLSFNVTVIDNEFPTITCPADITANTDAGQCYATVSLGTPVATDNCLITSLTNNAPVTFPVGATTVIWTAVDNQGNTVTCNQLVTVTDIEMPIAACQNISINLDGTGNAMIVAADIDNASSDACGVTLSASQTAFTCANVGANSVILTVTDANGNVSTCTSTVTVVDNIAPVALCQITTVQLDATGNASITSASVDNASTDNCAIASMTVLPNAFTCANIGANPVVLTVTDVNGNVSTCNATVTIEDNVTPVALCQNVDVFLDATGNGSTTAALVDNGSSDACGIASLALSQTAFDCLEIGLNPVTLTVIDNNGNSSTCAADVNVIDNIAPVAVCQDITVQLNASGVGTIVVADINNGSSDACGIASTMLSQTSFSCAEVGTKLVTLTVTDVNYNSSTCTSTLTIEDNIAPIAVCQDITVQLDASGNAAITGTQINNGSSDACGITTLSVSPSTFDCTNIGGNAVVLTVTDVNGNASTCNATVTVQDNVAPTAVCQNITLFLDGTGNVTMVAADIDGGSTDACGIASLAVSQTAFTCANIGANNVVLTVTDNYGNTSSCTAVVTVIETTPPVAVCQNISINLNAAGLATILPIDLNNGSTDNCSIANYSASQTSFDCTDLGANTVTLTVTDGSGNATTCTSIVTVSDIILPTAICQNIAVNLNGAGTVSITPNMINNGSFDNCTIASISASQTAFTCANVGPNNVTLTIIDQSGNTSTCTAIVTVVDNIAPTAICQNATANLDATGNATVVPGDINDGSFDNCGILSTVLSTSTFTCANVGPNPVTLTVTDVNGNVSTCSSTVTVIDAIDPTMICQNISVNLDATGNASIVANDLNNGSFDNCGIASLGASQTSFNCSNVGANNIILTATDVNGNTNTCTSVVTVIDAVAPNALCQNISVNLDATGNATITGAMINNASTDACGIASLVASPAAFTCANVGPNSVTLTVTDVNGNASTCTSTVTVVDNIAPTAICQNFTANLDAFGNATITVNDINNASTDNCAIATSTASTTNFTCSNVGNNTVTLTLTDVNGNVAACNAIVTIVDVTAPAALCQNQTLTLDIFGNASTTVSALNNGSTDACGIASITASQLAFDCSDLGANNITLTVTDVNGNVSTCASVVTVQDLIAPTVVTQNITVALDATGSVTITGAMITAAQFDNCAITSSVLPTSTFDCTDIGPNTVTLIVSDASGNTATGTAIVTVIDNMAPTALCQDLIVNLDAAGTASVTAAMINNGSTDNCGILSVTASPLNFTCANVGNNNVTLTVNDVNGNTANCLGVVTVVDNIAPVALCQNVNLNLDSNGDALLTPAMVNNGSSDNCSVAFMSVSQANFSCANTGANTITFTATDASGNSSTCTSTITILDLIAPNALCQDITLNLDATGNAVITAAMIDNLSNDNCGVASLTASQTAFTCGNVGTNNVTLTVADPSGNTSACTSIVTVVDNVAPVANCQNTSINLDASGMATITAAMIDNTSTDACGIATLSASTTNFTCANVGANNVTLTVTDVNGNTSTCTSFVTVVDNINPTAICQNVTVSLNPAGNAAVTAAMLNNGSFDNCGVASISASQTAFDCTNLGTNNITLTVTDVNGNIGTCVAIVTVIDGIAPVITCPASVTVNADAGICGATVALTSPIATDNCTVTITNNAPVLFPLGTTTVTWTATDAAGNTATCSNTVTVLDNQAPTITCPANITVNTDANICFATGVNLGTPVTADNCTVASVTNNAPSVFPLGTTTITWTAVDQAGNSSTCTQTVTVVDNQAPVVVCTSDIVLETVAGSCGRVVNFATPLVVDNCSVISMTQSDATGYTSGDIFPVGTTVISYTAVDGSGNTYTCSFNVTIEDNQYPVLSSSPADITVSSAEGSCDVAVSWVSPTANDNCPGVQLTTTYPSGSLFGPGTTVVTYQAVDNSGNITACSFNVTVLDGNAPIVPVLADVYNSCQVNSLPSPVADDICAGEITGTTTTIFPITTVGIIPVVWTFNDGNGNISTATQYVYIDGEIDATVTIVNDVTLMANNTNATYQWIDCATGNAIPGATNQTFVATVNGDYAVVLTENGCPAETSDCISIRNVGIEDVTISELSIYPNPSVGGVFTISFDGKIEKIEVVDMIGRIIAVETNLVNGKVNGSDLASGKYFVNIYTEGQVIVKEVIVVSK